LAETAFVLPMFTQPKTIARAGIRWFTPTVEVALCGHATLASAHVVFKHISPEAETIDFVTRKSGVLTCKRVGNGIEMDFPDDFPIETGDSAIWKGVLEGLRLKREQVEWVGKGKDDAIVVLAVGVDIKSLDPDFSILNSVPVRGFIATTCHPHSLPAADFRSRFFGPAVGINEDPVTGSAHTTLACYWTPRLKPDGGELRARQESTRGGEMVVVWDKAKKRVRLRGSAVEVASGKMIWS